MDQQYRLLPENRNVEGVVTKASKSFLWIQLVNDQHNPENEYSVMLKDITFLSVKSVRDLSNCDEIKLNKTKLRMNIVEINGKKSILSAWEKGCKPPTREEEEYKIRKYLSNFVENENTLSGSNLLKLPAKDVKSDLLSAKSVLVDTSSCYYTLNNDTSNDA